MTLTLEHRIQSSDENHIYLQNVSPGSHHQHTAHMLQPSAHVSAGALSHNALLSLTHHTALSFLSGQVIQPLHYCSIFILSSVPASCLTFIFSFLVSSLFPTSLHLFIMTSSFCYITSYFHCSIPISFLPFSISLLSSSFDPSNLFPP